MHRSIQSSYSAAGWITLPKLGWGALSKHILNQPLHKSIKLCSSQHFLNTSPQTPCWSQWPAWLFTPAMSSCRSTSWPSCTTLRLYSDTRTPSICLWPVCWSTCLTSLVPRRLLDSRQGLMLTTLRRIFSPVFQNWFDIKVCAQGHVGWSRSLGLFPQQRI